MREEISEPQQWRARPCASQSWAVRRRDAAIPLPAEVVDAAFNDDESLAVSHEAVERDTKSYPGLVARIHEQLALLEAQRVQLQKLLSQAGESPA